MLTLRWKPVATTEKLSKKEAARLLSEWKNPMAPKSELLAAAIAMSLYIYNVSPGERAEKLYRHFKGACADPDDLLRWVDHHSWATEMPFPTMVIYLEHALAKYGQEALEKVRINEMRYEEFMDRFYGDQICDS
jgi:hypothetical protein